MRGKVHGAGAETLRLIVASGIPRRRAPAERIPFPSSIETASLASQPLLQAVKKLLGVELARMNIRR